MGSTDVLTEDFINRGKLRDLGRWYITRFVRAVAQEIPAGARVLDAGAGECAYKELFSHCRYVAVDLGVGDTSWNYSNLDVFGLVDELPVASESLDAVICTQVLEHLSEPGKAVGELARALRSGGALYLTAPMSHHEHQSPYDFFRYTSFGLRLLLEGAGFGEIRITPIGGIFTRWAYELPRMRRYLPGSGLFNGEVRIRGLLALPLRLVSFLIIPPLQMLLLGLENLDSAKDDPFGWYVTAVK
jgi:SAM-dependent methyltransferase